jgi:asparagine synthase (glutamine-hydrolysing)
MCGIAGIFNLDDRPCDPDDVRRFVASLAHRGPDGEGVFTDGCVGLGHRRLSILDLTDAGKQPMRCLDGRYWITFNGEIYNFVELRKELEGRGYHFRTQSDTEVIVAAYDAWGDLCVLHFNGMWAFAIWDVERRELFLSRDRFGIKPLRYCMTPGRFAFASELKAFRHLAGFTVRENEPEMRNLLARGGMSMEDTIFQDVRRLPGGYNMVVSAKGMRTWRWWSTIDHLPQVPRRRSEQVEQFRELFFDAVRVRLRSDVPVGSCVSGGLDSSSILCAIPHLGPPGDRETADSHHAFVATFPGTMWDEREYAEEAIRTARAHAHILPIEFDDVLAGIRQYAYDIEMVGDNLSIPHWLTYRNLRRNGVVVTLDGNGADEMLAGYQRVFRGALRARGSLFRAPVRTLDLIGTLRGLAGEGSSFAEGPPGFGRLLTEYDPFLRQTWRVAGRGMTIARTARGALHRRPRSSPAAAIPVAPEWTAQTGPITYMDEETLGVVAELGPFKGQLYKEFHGTNLPLLLRTFDRCSMAHGIEMRMPFMDWRLVTYVFALPEQSIAGGGYTKRVLREAMRGVLPEKIRTRRGKIGFNSPMSNWFNGALGDWVMREVESPRFLESELWNGPVIRDFVAERHRARNWSFGDARRVWRFVQAHLWREAVFA